MPMNGTNTNWTGNLQLDLCPEAKVTPTLAQTIPADAADFAQECLHFTPDAIQANILRSPSRRIILCMGRRSGKTYVVAARAVHFALTHPNTQSLLFSGSQRQSDIVLHNIRDFLAMLSTPLRGDGSNKQSLLLP